MRNKMLIYLFAFDTVLWVMDYSWDTSSLNYNTSMFPTIPCCSLGPTEPLPFPTLFQLPVLYSPHTSCSF